MWMNDKMWFRVWRVGSENVIMWQQYASSLLRVLLCNEFGNTRISINTNGSIKFRTWYRQIWCTFTSLTVLAAGVNFLLEHGLVFIIAPLSVALENKSNPRNVIILFAAFCTPVSGRQKRMIVKHNRKLKNSTVLVEIQLGAFPFSRIILRITICVPWEKFYPACQLSSLMRTWNHNHRVCQERWANVD